MRLYRKLLNKIVMSLFIMSYTSNMLGQSQIDKYREWTNRFDLKQFGSISRFLKLDSQFLIKVNPTFIGNQFYLFGRYNRESFTNVRNTVTSVNILTNVTTNPNVFSNTTWGPIITEDIDITNILGTSTESAPNWIADRANYLELTFGMTPADSLATAVGDRITCESVGADCSNYGLSTSYDLDIHTAEFDVTHPATSETTTSNEGPFVTTETDGNTVITRTTNREVTTTNTRVTTDHVIEDASVDTFTNAKDAEGGATGTVDTETREDTIGTRDIDPETTTTTSEKTTETTEERRTTTTETMVRKKARWKLDISPMLYIDANSPKYVMSLDTHFKSVNSCLKTDQGRQYTIQTSVQGERCQIKSPARLKKSNQNGWYRVVYINSLTVGLGAALNIYRENASGIMRGLNFFAGMMPVNNSVYVSDRKVRGLRAANNSPSLSLPYDTRLLNDWKPFDKVTYSTSGGVMFVAGVNVYGVLSFGVSTMNSENSKRYLANGNWSVTVQKVSDKIVYAQVVNTSLNSVSRFMGIGPANLSKTNIKKTDISFSFMYDLSKRNARNAFKQLLIGKVDLSQNLAKNKSIKSVIAIEDNEMYTQGTINGSSFSMGSVIALGAVALGAAPVVGLGISVVSFLLPNGTTSQAKLYTKSNSFYHPDGTKNDVHFGAYVVNSQGRFPLLSQEESLSYGFFGASYNIKSKTNRVKKAGMFGQIGWSYKNTGATNFSFNESIRKLIRHTGLKDKLDVRTVGHEDLGSVQIDFALRIDETATQFLLQRNADKYFDKSASEFMRAYFNGIIRDHNPKLSLRNLYDPVYGFTDVNLFSKEKNYSDICREYVSENDTMGTSGGAGNSANPLRLTRCFDAIKTETERAIVKLKESLSSMRYYRDQRNKREFVKSYALFGKEMLTNQFVFQSVFQLVKGRGASAKYTVSGANIKTYDIKLDWTPYVHE